MTMRLPRVLLEQGPMSPVPMERMADAHWSDAWLHGGYAWGGVLAIAFVANLIAKGVIVRGIRALASRTKTKWDDILVDHHVFERLSHVAPALVVYTAAPILLNEPEDAVVRDYVRRFANVWMVIAGARAAHTLVDAFVAIGQSSSSARDKPLRSYAQVAQIVLWGIGTILAVAILMQKSPWALLTGLGAMTAILLLVFKDSILGFVASVRIASNDMVRLGDWIEMPKYGADGDVVDIGLHTVKIQNWDKTISMIPTHTFMTDTFKNWRGMTESGGRRIKRSLLVDMTSVRFLGDGDVERLGRISCLAPYLEVRSKEVAAWNDERAVDGSTPVNGRRLTNLGTFRAYVEAYLREQEPIRQDMTFLVRQLAPGVHGVALEIYCFSGEQRWAHYEAIMGDIFDHLLAAIGEFDLRVYQSPSASDVRSLGAAEPLVSSGEIPGK